MKEMQLFEVGFKDRFRDSRYHEKINVVANDASDAEAKARKWLIDGAIEWDGDGDDKQAEKHVLHVKNLRLARLHHVGEVIV